MRYARELTYLAIASTVLTWTLSCSGTEQAQKEETRIAVKAEIVQRSDQELVREYTGSLEGQKQAVLRAKISEAVGSVQVREGQTVRADQILLELNREGASSQYHRTLSLFRNAEKNVGKMEYLFKEGAVSESDYDAARTDFEVARANLDAVTRLVEIHSPIAGTVTSLDVEEGDFVQIGQNLVTVATTDRLRVKFGVNADEIAYFSVGGAVRINSDAVTEEGNGKVAAIASSADPLTRTFQVEAILENTDGLFSPGMFVRVRHIKQQLQDVIAVPRRSVLTLDEQPTVFTVVNGEAQKHTVALGVDLGGQVIVESGLEAGDTLVVLGQDYLDTGTRVNITALNGIVK
ncbi:MAG: efflux RND transporter periplasmic adaptor subunit [Candidatus Zixiibacteriota bacterium]|nr:MAG: efflux RND transporter periplasmic adaptor subunit [candidate division Zixibacteria bacterium]